MDEKILNPLTGRYVKKTGKIGKKILLNQIKKKQDFFYINDIIPIIGKYFIEPKYTKFKDFVTANIISNSISNVRLCQNINAILFLEKNIKKISWKWLSLNPNAIPLLEKYKLEYVE